MSKYAAARNARNELKDKIAAEYSLTDLNSKQIDLIFDRAWEESHGCGEAEIRGTFDDLAFLYFSLKAAI